jgi:hypothetical protein
MKDFDVCSLWSECSKVMKCIHPDTGEISAAEWEHACTTARRYKKGINYFVCNGNNQAEAREKKTASIIENTKIKTVNQVSKRF